LRLFMINKKLLKQLDFSLIIIAMVIVLFGAFNIYCAMQPTNQGSYYFLLQCLWLLLGIIVIYLILIFDYAVFEQYAGVIYFFGVALLIFNNITSKAINGASMWIKIGSRAIEPGEFARLCLILMLAKQLQKMEGNTNKIKNFMILVIYSIIPMILIFLQPDLGLTMVCFFVAFGIFYVHGLKLKVIISGILAILIGLAIVWNSGLIQPYQKSRLTAFIDPSSASEKAKYQLDLSKKSIGSGEIVGKGIATGSFVDNSYVPENFTDFIFSVVGNQWGFIGGVLLLFLYAILIMKIIAIGRNSKDIFGAVICTGVVSSLLFSIFQNIGMTIGLMPISGITLPFMSYGGSSLLTNFISLGLVLSVGMRRKKINF